MSYQPPGDSRDLGQVRHRREWPVPLAICHYGFCTTWADPREAFQLRLAGRVDADPRPGPGPLTTAAQPLRTGDHVRWQRHRRRDRDPPQCRAAALDPKSIAEREMGPDGPEEGRTDPRNRVDLAKRGETAKTVPNSDHPASQPWPDLGQSRQLGDRGSIEIDLLIRPKRAPEPRRRGPMPCGIPRHYARQELQPARGIGRAQRDGPERVAKRGNCQQ